MIEDSLSSLLSPISSFWDQGRCERRARCEWIWVFILGREYRDVPALTLSARLECYTILFSRRLNQKEDHYLETRTLWGRGKMNFSDNYSNQVNWVGKETSHESFAFRRDSICDLWRIGKELLELLEKKKRWLTWNWLSKGAESVRERRNRQLLPAGIHRPQDVSWRLIDKSVRGSARVNDFFCKNTKLWEVFKDSDISEKESLASRDSSDRDSFGGRELVSCVLREEANMSAIDWP